MHDAGRTAVEGHLCRHERMPRAPRADAKAQIDDGGSTRGESHRVVGGCDRAPTLADVNIIGLHERRIARDRGHAEQHQ